MPFIQEFINYQRREFCHANQCLIQTLLYEEEPSTERYETNKKTCQPDYLRRCHYFLPG